MTPTQCNCNCKPIRTPNGVQMVYANHLYCTYCPMVFSTANGKKRHEMYHEGNRPYSCDDCQASFTRVSRLDSHKVNCIAISSLGDNIKWCSFCDYFYKNDDLLKKHYDRCHGILYDPKNPRVYKIMKRPVSKNGSLSCDLCGLTFKSAFFLGGHKYGTHKVKRGDDVGIEIESSKDTDSRRVSNDANSEIKYDSTSSEDEDSIDLDSTIDDDEPLQEVPENKTLAGSDDELFLGFSS